MVYLTLSSLEFSCNIRYMYLEEHFGLRCVYDTLIPTTEEHLRNPFFYYMIINVFLSFDRYKVFVQTLISLLLITVEQVVSYICPCQRMGT